MRKIVSTFILISVLISIFNTMPVSALTNGFLYYVISHGEVTITSCVTSYLGGMTIPSVINTYPVTTIAPGAFENCTGLNYIGIPDSVKSIGAESFKSCNALKSVNMADSVKSIGDGAFDSCSSLSTITISNSVTYIPTNIAISCTILSYQVVLKAFIKVHFIVVTV